MEAGIESNEKNGDGRLQGLGRFSGAFYSGGVAEDETELDSGGEVSEACDIGKRFVAECFCEGCGEMADCFIDLYGGAERFLAFERIEDSN